jgi:hypothetical protein
MTTNTRSGSKRGGVNQRRFIIRPMGSQTRRANRRQKTTGMGFRAGSQSASATRNVTIADSTASTATNSDETMPDAAPLDSLTTKEPKGGEGAVEKSPPCDPLGGDAMAGGTATTAHSAVGDGDAAPDPVAASTTDTPATQGAVEHSPSCNLPGSNTIAGRTASAAYTAAATRPVVPVRTVVKLSANIVRLQSKLKKDRANIKMVAENAIRSSECAKDLLKDLMEAEEYGA